MLALKVRELPRIRWVAGAALALGALPWLGLVFTVAGLVIALAMLRWLRRRARGFALLVEVEVLLFSVVMFVTINDQLFGGFTPAAAALPGDRLGDLDAGDFLDRAPRLVALWLDRDVRRPALGAGRRARVLRAVAAVALAPRPHRPRAARARATSRSRRLLCALVCAAQVLVAAFVAPTMFGFFFPGRYLVAALPVAVALVAWGLRQAPRVGGALVAITLVTSVWWYAELRLGGARDRRGRRAGSRAPLGPLDGALPLFGTDAAGRGDRARGGRARRSLALVACEWRSYRARTVTT